MLYINRRVTLLFSIWCYSSATLRDVRLLIIG